MAYFMTPKVTLTFDIDLDLKVKHLTWQVITNVQAALLCDKAVNAFYTYRVCSFIMFILVMLTIAIIELYGKMAISRKLLNRFSKSSSYGFSDHGFRISFHKIP